tara:strand:+ start:2543 stop:2776 length:234 start_codon:yes stop_codon:yes gene_type:complete
MESMKLLELINETLLGRGLYVHYELNVGIYTFFLFPVNWPIADKHKGYLEQWSFIPSEKDVMQWAIGSAYDWDKYNN